jgi:hypothetical protein
MPALSASPPSDLAPAAASPPSPPPSPTVPSSFSRRRPSPLLLLPVADRPHLLRALPSLHSSPRRRATPARDPPSFNPSPLCSRQNREYSCGSDEVGCSPLDPLLRLRVDLSSQVRDPIPLGFHVMRVRLGDESIGDSLHFGWPGAKLEEKVVLLDICIPPSMLHFPLCCVDCVSRYSYTLAIPLV